MGSPAGVWREFSHIKDEGVCLGIGSSSEAEDRGFFQLIKIFDIDGTQHLFGV
jgi:hypothetical protein